MMNKILSNKCWMAALALLTCASCEVDQFEAIPLASLSVTNAVPGSPTVDVLVDGKVTSTNRLPFQTTSASKPGSSLVYLPVSSGQRNILLSPDTGKTNIAELNLNFATGDIYSVFLYDSVVNGKVKMLTLKENLPVPTGTNISVRFLHLAPNAGPLDLTMVRGTLYDDTTLSRTNPVRTFVPTDSVTIQGKSYIGANPDPAVLTPFSTTATGSNGASIVMVRGFANVPAGNRNNRYRLKVKAAGTQNVLASLETATLTLTTGKIFTIYVAGTARNTPLTVNFMTNY